jgi:hypothetical protein
MSIGLLVPEQFDSNGPHPPHMGPLIRRLAKSLQRSEATGSVASLMPGPPNFAAEMIFFPLGKKSSCLYTGPAKN